MEQHVWFQRAEGLAVFLGATAVYFSLGFGWLGYVLLLLAFDVFMAGYLWSKKAGAVVYNIGHSLVLPAAVGAAGVLAGSAAAAGLALVWFAHIGIDRALGYGLKTTAGFAHTHLGTIGRKRYTK